MRKWRPSVKSDPLSKAAEQLQQLQQMGFTGSVCIKLELSQGGIRSCHFGTDQKIHPQERKEKNKLRFTNKNT